MRPDVRAFLGQTVTVVIDRPLGSRHPRYPDLVYPVNYGYVPGVAGGDGAALDAYVLGVGGPVAAFTGVVIAVVLRADDVEDKLVVAPPGTPADAGAIAAQLAFQEQYFISEIVVLSAECSGSREQGTGVRGQGAGIRDQDKITNPYTDQA